MDISLIRTFLEVAATGSFVNAADRLFVTQSAVSLRVQRLEDTLGQQLFTRSKAGAELTTAGREFESYALSLIKLWQEARQQIALPAGFKASLSIGAQYSLWPGFGFRWIDALREAKADLNIRADIGLPDRLTRLLIEGVIDAALVYTPQVRPGLIVEKVMEEDLIMIAAWPDADYEDMEGRYAFIDWGPEFVPAHAMHLPKLTNPGLTLALGAMSAQYIRGRDKAAYVPARYAKRFLDREELFLVPDAPVFPYPAYSVLRDDLPADILELARKTLANVAKSVQAEQDDVVEDLEEISEDAIETLGETTDLSDEENSAQA